jgi:SSS family solute:Na+ symporter
VKLGALMFIFFVPTTFIINLQLLGGIIIIQTLPSVFLALFTKWFHRWALIAGWVVGIASGIAMFAGAHNSSVYTFVIAGHSYGIYSALSSFVINLLVSSLLTAIFQVARVNRRDTAKAEA